jgi:hypothetical protein
MRNKLVAAAITGLVAAPGAHAAADVSWFGFNQITLEQQGEVDAGATGPKGGGFEFGADRIRIGYKAKFDNGAYSKLQVDFNEHGPAAGGSQLPDIIKDALVGYDFGAAKVQAGMFKTPVGMDFNTSGKKLDITKRGMEKQLVLERSAGAMVSGGAQGFGYKVGVFNPATRGAASNVATPNSGENYAYAANVSYDMGKMLHAELGYGVSQGDDDQTVTKTFVSSANIGATGEADDYTVFDIGLKSQPMPNLTLKAEYIDGSNYASVEDLDRTVWFLHGGYEFTPMLEGVIRHYASNVDSTSVNQGTNGGNDIDSDYSETFVGLNIFLNPEKHHEARIQLNYVMPSGDDDEVLAHDGARAVTDEDGEAQGTFLAQFQTSF